MRYPVKNLINAIGKVREYFDVDASYVIKPLPDVYWRLWTLEDMQFLTYWNDDVQKTDVLIVKEGERPLIYEKDDYTMVIAIECIKTALIFKNSNKTN